MQRHPTILSASLLVLFLAFVPSLLADESGLIFDVKSYGASGKRRMTRRRPSKAAVDACAKAGGGTVGTAARRVHVGDDPLAKSRRFSSTAALPCMLHESADFDKRSLLYAEDAQNITIEGPRHPRWDKLPTSGGRINSVTTRISKSTESMLQARATRRRTTAAALPDCTGAMHMVLLLAMPGRADCRTFFLHSRSWTSAPTPASELTIDGIYIYTSPKEAGLGRWHRSGRCKERDISIARSRLATTPSCSTRRTPLASPPCENITVTNCRLSSVSAALSSATATPLRPQCDGGQLRDYRRTGELPSWPSKAATWITSPVESRR